MSRRVAIVTPWYGAAAGHGVAVATESLVWGLLECGWKPTVLVPVGDGWLPTISRGRWGERIVSLPLRPSWPGPRAPKAYLGFVLRLPAALAVVVALRVAGVRVAHFHFCVPEFATLSVLFRLTGVSQLVTFHGTEVVATMDHPPLSLVLPRMARRATRVATVSAGLRRILLKKVPISPRRVFVVHNSLPPGLTEAALGMSKTSKVPGRILFVGHLTPIKGPDVMVRAFTEVLARCPEAHLVLFGEGPLRQALLDEIRSLGLDGAVELRGRALHAELLPWYAAAPIVVVPSRTEGFSLVALEAALLGCAVVASRVGGLPEVVRDGETGLLVSPEDPAALAAAIIELLRDPDRTRAMGGLGRRSVLARSIPRRVAARYARIYNVFYGKRERTITQS